MIRDEILYCLDDMAIVPAPLSYIESRNDCNARWLDGKLPLWTSPMPNVINRNTLNVYKKAGINTIIPRGNGDDDELKLRIEESKNMFVAFSLNEFETNYPTMDGIHYVLIDMANGHMNKLCETIRKAKLANPELIIMAGNVAHPATYQFLSDCGADYVRISIGTGSACNTTTFTGVGYGMATLIDECASLKRERERKNIALSKMEGCTQMKPLAKIIADGGCNKIRDIIKCLALGADYVMLGGMFNSCKDSAGELVWVEEAQDEMKLYYGMASKRGAEELGKSTDYPEGKVKYNKVTGTVEEFANKVENYLKSAMSYCNSPTLDHFTRYTELRPLSPTAQKAFNQV